MSKITVTVSGPVGAGKTTLCAKLQILLKHLGCDVEWKEGAAESNMGIEEWPNEFKTPIELVEKVIPTLEPKVTQDQIRELIVKHSEWTPQGFALVDTHRNKFAEELIALVQRKEMNLTTKNIAREP
jgi:broad-specificity NMP kinase